MNKSLLFVTTTLFLLSACASQGPDVETPPEKIQEINIPMPKEGEIAHPTGGLEEWLGVGAMSATGTTPANGVAQAHFFEKGLYLFTVNLNIETPPEGAFYEAWVSDGTNTVSMGHLQNPMGDVRHSVKFESNQDLRTYTSVSVSQEADDGNPALGGTVVASGVLKDSTRQ